MLNLPASGATLAGDSQRKSLSVAGPHGIPGVNSQAGDELPVRMAADQWELTTLGLKQRFQAVDLFLTDVLTHQGTPEFLSRNPLANAVVTRAARSLAGARPAIGSWTWMASSDLVIRENGDPVVLDHNFDCPAGLQRLSELSGRSDIHETVDLWLRSRLQFGWCSFEHQEDRLRVAVLDAGSFSPAYRENEYLATQLGGRLISNRDVVVRGDGVYAAHHRQLERLDLLIRRVEDAMLDPNCFRPDSLIGVPGLVRACREQQACVLNPPGTGMMSNRAVSGLIPEMVRHYLGEDPLLATAELAFCGDPATCGRVLENLRQYAVRTVDPLHPARPFFGSAATASEISDIQTRVQRDPQNFVARPLLSPLVAATDRLFNLRVFSGVSSRFSLLPMGVGRPAQPDGGATLAIINDPAAFLVMPNAG